MRANRERMEFPAKEMREKLPGPTLPLIKATNVLYLDDQFNYRGKIERLPWPCAKKSTVIAAAVPSGYDYCPLDADWILLAAAEPVSVAPPKTSAGTILQTKVDDAKSAARMGIGLYMMYLGVSIVGATYLFKYLGKTLAGGEKSSI